MYILYLGTGTPWIEVTASFGLVKGKLWLFKNISHVMNDHLFLRWKISLKKLLITQVYIEVKYLRALPLTTQVQVLDEAVCVSLSA